MKYTTTIYFSFFLAFWSYGSAPEDYIKTYNEIAINEMIKYHIPASIILAQGMLESDFGRGELAKTANNHFGMKCGSGWLGGSYFKKDDDRDSNGNLIESCFRSYSSVEDSYVAHSLFIASPKKAYRYGHLFEFDSDDYVSWAVGLKDAGYATDKLYANKLIAIIENYELFKFDQKLKERIIVAIDNPNRSNRSLVRRSVRKTKNSSKKVKEEEIKKTSKVYGINCVKPIKGQTPRSISDEQSIHVDRLLTYNKGYSPDTELQEKDILYLEPKNNVYKGKKRYHVVKKGDSMFSISQHYGLKLSVLHSRNRIPKGAEPLVGEKVHFFSVNIFGQPKYKLKKEEEEFLFD